LVNKKVHYQIKFQEDIMPASVNDGSIAGFGFQSGHHSPNTTCKDTSREIPKEKKNFIKLY
jgi:hypothetical protein